jgi:hypothetical protein
VTEVAAAAEAAGFAGVHAPTIRPATRAGSTPEDPSIRPLRRYIQNHVAEPVMPVRWVIDGYEELALPREEYTAEVLAGQEPYPDDVPYDIARYGPGEAEFFRMPCIQFRGTEYVVSG